MNPNIATSGGASLPNDCGATAPISTITRPNATVDATMITTSASDSLPGPCLVRRE
jgi:hypothetical protein